jgi:hypothetical protein
MVAVVDAMLKAVVSRSLLCLLLWSFMMGFQVEFWRGRTFMWIGRQPTKVTDVRTSEKGFGIYGM